MGDESFFEIQVPQPTRDISTSPWVNEPNFQRQQAINHTLGINNHGAENVSFPVRPTSHNYQASNDQQTDNIDSWNPMDDDFACPTFNSYKYFDILAAERPGERSPEKGIRQSPEKRAEEISLYVGNIPLGIGSEGIRNLFLAVGEVQSCKVFPPKDPSSDTKYGFVKFCTWREAIKAIETYDGFYVGSEKKLRVKVAHKRRGGGDVIYDDGSSSDGPAQDQQANCDPLVSDTHNNDDENTTDQDPNVSPQLPVVVNDSNSEQAVGEKLPSEASKTPPAPQALFPCTKCEELCTQRCSACKAPYCSRTCQKADRARHKLVCTYKKSNTPKPANQSTPTPPQVTTNEPDPFSDSDFDCIDISLDTSYTPSKGKTDSRDEVEGTMQSPSMGSVPLDSGYTTQKEDTGNAIENVSRFVEQRSDSERAPSNDVSLRSDLAAAQTWQVNDKKEFLAYVTAVSTANTFWAVVRNPDYSRFCELTTRMAEMIEENLERITVANVGSLCLARFSVDDCWYRCRITNGNGEQVEVTFVDYGNTEWKNVHDLYQLPPGFADVPPQAQKFSLNGVSVAGSSGLEQRMVKLLDNLVSGKILVAQLVYNAPGCIPEVILRENDARQSINQLMLNYVEQQSHDVQLESQTQHHSVTSHLSDNTRISASDTTNSSGKVPSILTNDPVTNDGSGQSDNTSCNNPMASYVPNNIPGTLLVSDLMSAETTAFVSDNLSPSDPMTSYISNNIPPDGPVTSYELDKTNNTSVNDPITSHASENISGRNRTRSFGSDNMQGNDQMFSYSSDHSPQNDRKTIYTAYDPTTGHVLNQNLVNPPSNIGFKPHMASEVPGDVLPSTNVFDILVCHFLTPSQFWIWFRDTAKEIFHRLTAMLSATYEGSTCSKYLPITGELIAAKFTDGVWYRAMVNCVNNDGSLRVTFIDFGNSEDVYPFDIRRITDALVVIPRLATKCALYGLEQPSRKWSAECLQFCNELMLNKQGSATIENQSLDKLVLRVNMDINGEVGSVVDEIVKQGYVISEQLVIQGSGELDRPISVHSEQASPNRESSVRYQPLASENKPVLPSKETVFPNSKPVFPDSQPALPTSKPVSPSYKPEEPSLSHQQPAFGYQLNKRSNHRVCPNMNLAVPLPINQSVSLSAKPVPLHNKPAFPDMKPPENKLAVPCERPVYPDSKPAIFSNQPVSTNLNPKPVIPAGQPVAVNNNSAFPASHGGKPVLPLGEKTNSNNVAARPRTADPITKSPQHVATNSPKSSLQSSTPLFQISANSIGIPGGTLLPLPTVPTTAFDVIVNDVYSAKKFYVQMTDPNLVSQLQKCVRELNEYVTKSHPPKVENVIIGSLGCAKFSHDNVWYRAQVSKVDKQNYKVRFIDFGNVQVVSPDEFLKAPEFFYQLAPQAIHCRLGTSDHDQAWRQESRNLMKKLILNKKMKCTVLGGTSWPHYAVKLQQSVGDELVDVAEEFLKAMTWLIKSRHSTFADKVLTPAILSSGIEKNKQNYEVFVTSVAHPTYFCAQYASPENLENIKRLCKDLNNHYKCTAYHYPFKPDVNSLCVYISSKDHNWYRVFVKCASPKGLLVNAVDFGFHDFADESQFRPLEERFRSLPFGSILFTMSNVVPPGSDGKIWPEEVCKYFRSKILLKVVKVRLNWNSKARLFVDVFDPDSSEESLLNTALVAKGMAREARELKSGNYPGVSQESSNDELDFLNSAEAESIADEFPNTKQCGESSASQGHIFKSLVQEDIRNSTTNIAQGDINNVQVPGQNNVPGVNYQTPYQYQHPGFTSRQSQDSSINVAQSVEASVPQSSFWWRNT